MNCPATFASRNARMMLKLRIIQGSNTHTNARVVTEPTCQRDLTEHAEEAHTKQNLRDGDEEMQKTGDPRAKSYLNSSAPRGICSGRGRGGKKLGASRQIVVRSDIENNNQRGGGGMKRKKERDEKIEEPEEENVKEASSSCKRIRKSKSLGMGKIKMMIQKEKKESDESTSDEN